MEGAPGRRTPSLELGQGIVEYGLILSLMAAVAAIILIVFGGALAEFLSVVGNAIYSAT